jgi:hypothetical protein
MHFTHWQGSERARKNRARTARKPKIRWEVLGLPRTPGMTTSIDDIRQQVSHMANRWLEQGPSPDARKSPPPANPAPTTRGAVSKAIAFNRSSVGGVRRKINLSLALLVLALGGLVGCDYEARAAGGANPVRVAEMRQTFRDLWLGHIYWVQHAVLNSAMSSPARRDAVEKEVDANTKQIANMVTPFYGETASQKLFSLLDVNIDAVREYSEATVVGNKPQQDAALTRLANNAEGFAEFFSGVNPYLPKDNVRNLIAAHGAHHVLQINQYKKKEYAHVEETWTIMRQHIFVIADTLTTALAKQFPDKFS